MDSGKLGKSKEEIRRMMRLTAAKMQMKKPLPTGAINSADSASGSSTSGLSVSAGSSTAEQGSRVDSDSVKGHPFARYNSLNQLTCILCGCPVKSSLLWKAHLASRAHRANAESLRSRGGDRAVEILSGAGIKRRLVDAAEKQQQQKPSQGLGLAYSDDEEEEAKSDSESASKKTSSAAVSQQQKKPIKQQKQQQQQLPEGFFDDPVADARARNVPYKDRMEEELELFAREMRDAQVESDKLAEEAEVEADSARYLEEINTQEEAWRRLNELELLKEAAAIKREAEAALKREPTSDGADSDVDEAELELGLDSWRKKKL